MDIKAYIKQEKKLYYQLLFFIETSNDLDDDFQRFISFFPQIEIKKQKLGEFLYLISKIAKHHQRDPEFVKKIEKILLYFKYEIKQTLSNSEIFNIFKSNMFILLILFENQILAVDKDIFQYIYYKQNEFYLYFFYPEIKEFIQEDERAEIEKVIQENDSDYFINYKEKRKIGENDSYICSLIRNDSIKEFIVYINNYFIELDSYINPSIYETNLFLIYNVPTLIEYGAFFGSIQIIRYIAKKVELKPKIWVYAIHSNNAEVLNFLDDNDIVKDQSIFIDCLIESIKCHHNNIAEFIRIVLIDDASYLTDLFFEEKGFRYYNYKYFPNEINGSNSFFNLCKYHHYSLVNFILKIKRIKALTEDKSVEMSYYDLLTEDKIKNGIFNRGTNEKVKYSDLSMVAIPPSIKFIEKDSFKGSKIKQILIPSSVTYIGEKSFKKCKYLTDVKIPYSVKSIGSRAFSKCKRILEIIILSSITAIQRKTFFDCKKLKKIYIPHSVTRIENCAFYGCNSLVEIFIPPSVKSIGDCAFENCILLTNITLFPPLEVIGNKVFSGCRSLLNISLPSSLTTIGRNAFYECVSLIDITIPNSVTDIYEYAFSRCSSLQNVELSDKLIEISEGMFNMCTSLVNVTIPPSIQYIGTGAFNKCESFVSFRIPSSVISIGFYAFNGCIQMSKIDLSESLKLIPRGCFSGCISLENINIPEKVEDIQPYAFYECCLLNKVSIPSSICYIGNFAFGNCISLSQIEIPQNISVIEANAFSGCHLERPLQIPPSAMIIENDFSVSGYTRLHAPFEEPDYIEIEEDYLKEAIEC